METDANFRALLDISFGSPVKEPSLKVPLMESLAERCPVPRALFVRPSKSPVWQPPPLISGFPQLKRGFLERRLNRYSTLKMIFLITYITMVYQLLRSNKLARYFLINWTKN